MSKYCNYLCKINGKTQCKKPKKRPCPSEKVTSCPCVPADFWNVTTKLNNTQKNVSIIADENDSQCHLESISQEQSQNRIRNMKIFKN